MAKINQNNYKALSFRAKIGSFFGRIFGSAKSGSTKTTQFIQRKPFWSFFGALLILLALIFLGATVFKTKPQEQSKPIVVKDVQTFKIGSSPKVSDSGKEASKMALGTAFKASVSACTKVRFESNVPPVRFLPSSN
jgi:hypothetical protein